MISERWLLLSKGPKTHIRIGEVVEFAKGKNSFEVPLDYARYLSSLSREELLEIKERWHACD